MGLIYPCNAKVCLKVLSPFPEAFTRFLVFSLDDYVKDGGPGAI